MHKSNASKNRVILYTLSSKIKLFAEYVRVCLTSKYGYVSRK